MYALLNSPTLKCLFHFLKEEMEGRVKFFSFLPHVMISEITFLQFPWLIRAMTALKWNKFYFCVSRSHQPGL